MSIVMTSNLATTLKATLGSIVDDKTDGIEKKAIYNKWCDTREMYDAWEEDLEIAGPGYAAEQYEGKEISTGTILEGPATRYLARKFGLRLIITEETLEDNKYPESVKAARRLKRAIWKTVDLDTTFMLMRGFNTSYVSGDGQCLWSTSHPLIGGGVYANTPSVHQSPSRAAVITHVSAMRRMPGHDGTPEPINPKKVTFPVEQWAVWDGLILSRNAPEAGQYNEINVVNRLDLEPVANPYWTNSSTNYAYITDAEDGLNLRWKRKPRGRAWVDNSQELMIYSNTARWSRGWSNPRGSYGVNA
jgi:hypothetical protein